MDEPPSGEVVAKGTSSKEHNLPEDEEMESLDNLWADHPLTTIKINKTTLFQVK